MSLGERLEMGGKIFLLLSTYLSRNLLTYQIKYYLEERSKMGEKFHPIVKDLYGKNLLTYLEKCHQIWKKDHKITIHRNPKNTPQKEITSNRSPRTSRRTLY